MTLRPDPDFVEAYAAIASWLPPKAAPGDWRALREATETNMSRAAELSPRDDRVRVFDHSVRRRDGSSLLLRLLVPAASGGEGLGPALVYMHGGAMMMLGVAECEPQLSAYAAESGVPILAVDFRNAPEAAPADLAEDALRGVQWLHEHADDWGIDPRRIAIGGESGGAGIAAGATILARERGISISKQILICPMLDDRNVVPDPALEPYATWSYADNWTAWTAVLGDRRGQPEVPASVAPARLHDHSDLPPAYIDVGELDIFRDESIRYALGLLDAGVHVDLHLHPGAPHGFESIAAGSSLARAIRARRIAAIASI
ncbi:alpha/beta hydrolase fold domain-containing protein [Microbacterium sp. NPDC056044]|uniref:alpha/beta hydrolase fold domain-containing protein n=1 Tax=Microbacterium sp. NPDC056044 TaxID=3345690 RepID=UPI0035E1B73F